ncbi:unnamed protein product [Brugia timori]|uniref:Uncharacterized protein n=1 Tax=Brugia timori TaxID=42155 RepID=A0A0R3QR68_9BILA|nr:unnamed protein product [Brugia timori]
MSLLYKSPKFLSKRTKKTKPEVQRFLISRVNCDTNNIFCSKNGKNPLIGLL